MSRSLSRPLQSSNGFLASLPSAEFELLQRHLPPFQLIQSDILVQAGTATAHIYFPHAAIISFIAGLAGGQTTEIASAGRESLAGVGQHKRAALLSTPRLPRFLGWP